MAHDYSKLRGRIVEKFGTMGAFAKKLGVKQSVVSRKINEYYGITPTDMMKWSAVLGIDKADIGEYFFTFKVQEVELME